MAWKVYNVHSGKTVKAGFGDEENAKDWLELRRDLAQEDFLIEEMDDEEEEEWASREDDEDDDAYEPEAEDDVPVTAPVGILEGDDNEAYGDLFEEDEDEDEDEDQEDEEDF